MGSRKESPGHHRCLPTCMATRLQGPRGHQGAEPPASAPRGTRGPGLMQSPQQAASSPLLVGFGPQKVFLKIPYWWGSWVARSVERMTSAQVMISQLVSSSPESGSVLTAQSLEAALDSVSPSLCPSPLCLSERNVKKKYYIGYQHFKIRKLDMKI